MVSVAPLTVIPNAVLFMVVVVPPDVIGADAVMLVAPAEVEFAASMLIEATPLLFVKAVDAGLNVTREVLLLRKLRPRLIQHFQRHL